MTTELEVTEGMRFDKGYISPYFATDTERMEAVLDEPYILLTDKKIGLVQDLVPVLEQVAKTGKPLLIIAQDIFIETLEELAKDDWIKAVVIRIDSPGGSALVSELLWRSIVKLKEHKPVIVSIGNIAASGGYYIATAADYIFANPVSVTGSIGVFAALPNAKNFLDKIFFSFSSIIPVSDPAKRSLSLVIAYLRGLNPFLSFAAITHSLSVAAIAAGPSQGSIVLFKKLNNCL